MDYKVFINFVCETAEQAKTFVVTGQMPQGCSNIPAHLNDLPNKVAHVIEFSDTFIKNDIVVIIGKVIWQGKEVYSAGLAPLLS